ncbi:HlyD family secretion protein [Tardiphaga alba]|uniref:HlyD family secretion protein n=1 Tax=Tardiphaga alba TaxID=340268 RepID=A0ABX8AI17_9BRAD|nr:efflux RND transporter periplasmic adaptor subunit [Tardiphaga alba]QUS41970.1 HlyD family secretion protein [Tardiphaga alba]
MLAPEICDSRPDPVERDIQPAHDVPERPKNTAPAGRWRIRASVLFVACFAGVIACLTFWFLVHPVHVLVQGEADATRIDIAARVDGKVGYRPASRGDNIAAGQLLFRIDNPELIAKLQEAEASLTVAHANLANVEAGTRMEVVAQRKAAMDSAAADLNLAQLTYERIKELADAGHAPLQRLDEVTNALHVAQRGADQATIAHQEAVAGHTKEERGIARADVAKAQASIETIRAQVGELTVRAPIAAQVYQIGSEIGEYVAPGVPLLSLVDLNDVWLQFNLREDLIRGLKPGDRFDVRIPALANRAATAVVRFISPKGEYAGWRATRATGDFDLRTFEVRAYPEPPLSDLRPGMSVYTETLGGRR